MAILSLLTLSLVSCTDLWADEGIGFSNLFSLDLRRHSAGEGIGFSNIFSLDLRRYRNAVVSTHSLDFGRVDAGSSQDRSFYLANRGEMVNDTLIVTDIAASSAAFTARPRSFPIPPDDSVRVDVTLSSSTGREQGTLTIRTNDPDHPTLEVQLISGLAAPVREGAGGMPVLRLGDSVQGSLTHTGLEGRKSWILEVYTKQSVQFTMRSDFDAYLRLYKPPESTRHLASGRKRTRRFARVERVLEPGTYRIEAASYRDRETGSFTLEVSPPVDPGLSFLEFGQQVSGALPQIGSEERQSYLFYAPTSRRIYFQAISTGLAPFRPRVRVYYTSSRFPLVGGLARPGEHEVIFDKFVPQGVYRVEVASEGDAEKGPYLLLVDQGQRPKSTLSPFTALKGLVLEPSYPNPFNANTTIRYIVPGYGAETFPTQTETRLSLKIYSITGQLVRVLVDETLYPGLFQKSWDGLDSEGQPVASGLYIYYLRSGNAHRVGKMLLIK